MFRVEMYFQVRRACLVEGMSVREASRTMTFIQWKPMQHAAKASAAQMEGKPTLLCDWRNDESRL